MRENSFKIGHTTVDLIVLVNNDIQLSIDDVLGFGAV
jgi:hypothetical protein